MIVLAKSVKQKLGIAALGVLTACQGVPQLGQGGSMASGSAGADGAKDAGPQLATCARPIGTAALVEPEQETLLALRQTADLPSPIPVLRLLMAQSGCFNVVDRGAALKTIRQEEELRKSGLLEASRRSPRGRLKRVDYLITPNILFSNPNAGGTNVGAAIGGLFGPVGFLAGAIAGSIRIKEAQTTLFLTDAETGEQVAVAEGSAKVTDFGGAGALGGFGSSVGGLAGVSGYGNTAEGKLIVAAFIDAHNELVDRLGAAAEAKRARTATTPVSYSRELVREIQEELKARGYYTSAVDGLYGRGTRKAIREFQQDEGLSVTGQPSEDLLTYLRKTAKVGGPGAAAATQ